CLHRRGARNRTGSCRSRDRLTGDGHRCFDYGNRQFRYPFFLYGYRRTTHPFYLDASSGDHGDVRNYRWLNDHNVTFMQSPFLWNSVYGPTRSTDVPQYRRYVRSGSNLGHGYSTETHQSEKHFPSWRWAKTVPAPW